MLFSYDVLSTPNNCEQLEADQREAVASRKKQPLHFPLSLFMGKSSERPGAVKGARVLRGEAHP
jgi:hypothetical protein